jgi:hypothetical protein
VAELDEEYIRKMEDVLAVYEKPYDATEPVVCLDEKPVSLHADVRPPQAATPGKIAKRDSEYERWAQQHKRRWLCHQDCLRIAHVVDLHRRAPSNAVGE